MIVGRRKELDRLLLLLGEGARLVSLLGPAGGGKTALARAVAAEYVRAHAGRKLLFCSLEAATDRSSALDAIAATLEVRDASAESVGNAIVAQPSGILVLDGAERIAAELGSLASAWLERGPRICLLITSRHPLLRDEEVRFEVPPLGPDDGRALFVARARAAYPELDPSAEDLLQIREIVRRLDGLPLAIEIVAARASVLSTAALLERFASHPQLLDLDKPTGPARHTTLESAIGWSWALLSDDEQRALAVCSVFEGGFRLEAAEALLGRDAAELLRRLIERSLMRTEREGASREHRFQIYQSVKMFASRRLDELSLRAEAEARHADFYLERCGARELEIYGPQATDRLDRLEAERDNLRAARERFGQHDPERAVRAGLISAKLCDIRGGDARFIDDLFALAERTGSAELRAQTHRAKAASLRVEGRLEEATAEARRALDLIREGGPKGVQAEILRELGMCTRETGDEEEARERFEEALRIARTLEDEPLEARALGNLGSLARLFDRTTEARAFYQRSLSIHRRLGDVRFQGIVLGSLGHVAMREGRLEEAHALFMRAKILVRRVRDRRSEGIFTGHASQVDFLRGNVTLARKGSEEAREILRLAGDRAAQALFLAFECAFMSASTGRDEPWHGNFRDAWDLLDLLGVNPHQRTLEILALVFELVRARGAYRRGRTTEARERLGRAIRGLHDAATPTQAAPNRGSPYATMATQIVAREIARAERPLGSEKPESTAKDATRLLQIAADGRWLRPPAGEVVDLSRRKALRRLVAHLAMARDLEPGSAVPSEELISAGWPNEILDPASGKDRLYVAISTLRRMGLKGILEARGEGYLLIPEIPFLRASP